MQQNPTGANFGHNSMMVYDPFQSGWKGFDGKEQIYDYNFNKTAQLSSFGILRTESITRLVGVSFNGNIIDSNFWITGFASGATITQGSGQMIINASSANASGSVETYRRARYLSANPNVFRAVVRLPEANVANNVRRFGAFDGADGVGYIYSGSNFGVFTRLDGVETTYFTGFNGYLGDTYTPNTSINTYEIQMTNSRAWFMINDTLLYNLGAPINPYTSNLSLKVRMQNQNINGASNSASIQTRVATIFRIGSAESRPLYRNISGLGNYQVKRGPGTLKRILLGTAGGNSNRMTVIDGTGLNGETMAYIDTSTSSNDLDLEFDFYNGLFINLANGTSPNITVIFD